MTLVEPTDDGFWYSAPTPGEGLFALFFTDMQRGRFRADRQSVADVALASAPATRARISSLEPDRIATFSASPSVTEWDPNARLFPVGDAALSMDPISGAALTFALRSGLEAARAIRAVHSGRAQVGAAYERGLRQVFDGHIKARRRIYADEAELTSGCARASESGSAHAANGRDVSDVR